MTDVVVKRVGCMGLCAAGPLVEIPETGQLFSAVKPDERRRRSSRALKAVKPDATAASRWARSSSSRSASSPRTSVEIDPESLDDYVARGGYEALQTGPLRDDLHRGPRGDHPERPPRPRRRRLPDRPQVDDRRQGAGHPEVRHLQRRRGRPGRVHGPLGPRERPVPRPRGHGDRRLRGPRDRGLHLLPRGVPARGGPPAHGDPAGAAGRLPRPGHRRHLVQLRRPDPPRRRRLRVRRGDGADRVGRGQARHPAPAAAVSRRSRACSAAPRSSTTSRPSPTCPRSCARASEWYASIGVGQEQGHQGVRARRAHREHGPRRGPDGHDACARSSTTSAAASSTGGRSRPSRPAARRAAASRPSSSTCR